MDKLLVDRQRAVTDALVVGASRILRIDECLKNCLIVVVLRMFRSKITLLHYLTTLRLNFESEALPRQP